jgi:hypothetical protein
MSKTQRESTISSFARGRWKHPRPKSPPLLDPAWAERTRELREEALIHATPTAISSSARSLQKHPRLEAPGDPDPAPPPPDDTFAAGSVPVSEDK